MDSSSRRGGERGAVTFKAILSVVVLIILAHTAYVFIPLYIAVYDFKSQMEREANFGSVKPDEAIYKSLMDYAKELNIPIDKKGLKVARSSDRIVITADYTMEVPTLFYKYQWVVSTEKVGILF